MRASGHPALLAAILLAGSVAIGWAGWASAVAAETDGPVPPAAPQDPNSCVACHRAISAEHVGAWLNSVHARAGVGCKTCHPGHEMIAPGQAHAPRSADPISVYELCGSCHKMEKQAFELSRHHALAVQQSSQATPTCIDCHTAVGTHILAGDQITSKCQTCHRTDHSAGASRVSAKALACLDLLRQVALASTLINERLASMRIADRRRKKLRKRIAGITEDFHGAATEWHLFNLDEVDGRLRRVLAGLEAMHRELGAP